VKVSTIVFLALVVHCEYGLFWVFNYIANGNLVQLLFVILGGSLFWLMMGFIFLVFANYFDYESLMSVDVNAR
jgi:hypothetical protein